MESGWTEAGFKVFSLNLFSLADVHLFLRHL